jgi:hypothetical protein
LKRFFEVDLLEYLGDILSEDFLEFVGNDHANLKRIEQKSGFF